jgi:capsular polysaccharide biosynthesis protein
MSQQALDLSGSVQIVRRHKKIVVFAVALGLITGVALSVHDRPMLTSATLVALSPEPIRDIQTQVVVASSTPVLANAMRNVDPAVPLGTLRSRIHVSSVTPDILEIDAEGSTAVQAMHTANAVADSYVSYIGSPGIPGAWVLEPATSASSTPLLTRLLVNAGIGALLGLVAGAIVALAVGRKDQRLWGRDEIADATGFPVLASIPVGHPGDVAGWRKLVEDYEPGGVHAFSLRKALHQLGLTGGKARGGTSIAVLSLSSDSAALALGPQLAAFAAADGIPTTLIIDRQQDAKAVAALRAACTAASAIPSGRSGNLLTTIGHREEVDQQPETALTVVVVAVDDLAPRVVGTIRTTMTVLGVSAGTTTAEQLARVAGSAAADGRELAGILVADPDSADQTTGRVPQPARSAQRRPPTRVIGMATEASR